jgi:hypothetical protein
MLACLLNTCGTFSQKKYLWDFFAKKILVGLAFLADKFR